MQIVTTRLFSGLSLLLLVIWSVALLGVLQAYRLENVLGHSICGPWGCGPPVSALVGYHGFWFVLLMPLAWLAKAHLSSAAALRWGTRLLVVAAVGIIVLLLTDGWGNSAAHLYLWQWCLFRLATFVDFPLVQLGLVGLLLRYGATNKSDSATMGTEQAEK